MVATTSLGADLDTTWQNLLAGQSGIRELTDLFVEEYNRRSVSAADWLRTRPEVSRVEARRMVYVERVAHIMSKRLWSRRAHLT